MSLEIGHKIENTELVDKDGVSHSLIDNTSKYTVLFFYPKDNTPGCTIESKGFSQLAKEFAKENIRVIGISGGTQKTKQKFCDSQDLQILMLLDEDFRVSKYFGVYQKKKFMGREYFGINRETFVLDKKGKIVQKYEKVKPIGHAKAVLEELTKTQS
ncbi:MAG: peroxiredoxin [Candidatus Woesearchaeota archaeon]